MSCSWGPAGGGDSGDTGAKGRSWVKDDKGFKVNIRDGYFFHRVKAYNNPQNKCLVTVEFHFKAPSTRAIRFQNKVKFKTGAWLRTDVWNNSLAGKRKYTYTLDTTNDGCWGAKAQMPAYLWVESCWGTSCTPKSPG